MCYSTLPIPWLEPLLELGSRPSVLGAELTKEWLGLQIPANQEAGRALRAQCLSVIESESHSHGINVTR